MHIKYMIKMHTKHPAHLEYMSTLCINVRIEKYKNTVQRGAFKCDQTHCSVAFKRKVSYRHSQYFAMNITS
jgi:hypothetical protein